MNIAAAENDFFAGILVFDIAANGDRRGTAVVLNIKSFRR
jgi:hypothetical protein